MGCFRSLGSAEDSSARTWLREAGVFSVTVDAALVRKQKTFLNPLDRYVPFLLLELPARGRDVEANLCVHVKP